MENLVIELQGKTATGKSILSLVLINFLTLHGFDVEFDGDEDEIPKRKLYRIYLDSIIESLISLNKKIKIMIRQKSTNDVSSMLPILRKEDYNENYINIIKQEHNYKQILFTLLSKENYDTSIEILLEIEDTLNNKNIYCSSSRIFKFNDILYEINNSEIHSFLSIKKYLKDNNIFILYDITYNNIGQLIYKGKLICR